MEYQALLEELRSYADEQFRIFSAKIIAIPVQQLIGVRTPQLRKLAKKYKTEWEAFLAFPDDYYEVTFLKCVTLGMQKYEVFTAHLAEILPHIANWALCDCFDAPCIARNREDFLQYIKAFRFSPHEFTSRYALVQLLKYYCEEEYLPFIFESVEECDHSKYYVSMAAAWLMAEVLIKHYDEGITILKKGTIPAITHNRAIQKARESFRLTAGQKDALKAFKRKI